MLSRMNLLPTSSSRLSQLAAHLSNPTAKHIRTMSYANTKLKLNTGAEIPAVGFGTWQDKDSQESAVAEALKAGYRHIDTARVYGTEPAVGKAIAASGIPRKDLFIVTKLWNHNHAPEDVEKACDASLKDLGLDYLDLYLMHWPSPFASGDNMFPKGEDGKVKVGKSDYVDTYKAMEKLVHNGKCRAIGISNFSQAELTRLLASTSIVPAAHQLEMHPYLAQHGFAKFHKEKGIVLTQYSPFGNSNPIYEKGKDIPQLIRNDVLVQIGKKYGGKSGAQVAIAWGVAKGHSVIPKSKTPERIRANLEGDFRLEKEDVEKIDGLDKKLRFNDPSESFGWEFYKDLDGKP